MNVTTTDDCPARHAVPHDDSTENDDSDTAPPTAIGVFSTYATGSALVCRVIDALYTHVSGLDTASPPSVMVTVELAEMVPAVVMVTWEAPDHTAEEAAPPLIEAEGATAIE